MGEVTLADVLGGVEMRGVADKSEEGRADGTIELVFGNKRVGLKNELEPTQRTIRLQKKEVKNVKMVQTSLRWKKERRKIGVASRRIIYMGHERRGQYTS